ncbi:GAF domain-containing protein [Rugamonas sp. FT81W]|uniref:histidine kinase n=1 Tax=Duganella vulcania TaxID=2692166 RepID=A0A845GNV4_9BURK|nr:GAF domain-containing sensor histidine kinase [Duganella vulcania]MYM94309.1 GAF domain-containing protein [Duganella vulcania]
MVEQRVVSDDFLVKWQQTTNVMAEVFDVPAGLIMRVRPQQIEVLVSSHTPGNPYEAHEKANLNTGLYCETVMATRSLLHVPDALEDEHWKDNPDVALNMISYLGVPLVWPNDEVFGTICVLDSKKRNYQQRYVDLLWEIKRAIEADFQVIEQQQKLMVSNASLLDANQALLRSNADLKAALDKIVAMQGELLRAEKMSALGSLVAGISHELNTPIGNGLMLASTLKSNAVTIAKELETGVTRKHMQEFISGVDQGADILLHSLGRAAELVASFKQVAVDQSSMRRREFDVKKTFKDILATLGPAIRKSGHQVVCDVEEGVVMDSYPGPLEQVLVNLVNNALVHAFPEGGQGHVTITARKLADDRIEVCVADDGVGIPEANIARVFDPFFTTRLGQGGSGLGLHVVYNQVTSALRGDVQVESTPGCGARFTLRVPRVAPLEPPSH